MKVIIFVGQVLQRNLFSNFSKSTICSQSLSIHFVETGNKENQDNVFHYFLKVVILDESLYLVKQKSPKIQTTFSTS
jgi:hypothetical protein